MYIGRFAPSPTGLLHIGSLLTAVASYADARSRGGKWLVRMEDLDPPREMAGAAEHILRTLEAFGFEWDGAVAYQSRRYGIYEAALGRLKDEGLVYPCYCSRKDWQAAASAGADGFVYSGRCRNPADRPSETGKQPAWRIRVPDETVGFDDEVVGHYAQNLARDIGDFVLLRADGYWAYQLAVVADDAEQGVTHVVRGQDLLVSTPRQCGAEVVETDAGSRLGYGAVRYAAAAGHGLSQPSSRPGYGPPARFIGLGGGKLAYGRRSRRRSLYGMICGYTTKRHKYLRICRLVSDGLPCLNG